MSESKIYITFPFKSITLGITGYRTLHHLNRKTVASVGPTVEMTYKVQCLEFSIAILGHFLFASDNTSNIVQELIQANPYFLHFFFFCPLRVIDTSGNPVP